MDGITTPRTDPNVRRAGARASAQGRIARASIAAGTWLAGLTARLAAGMSRAALNRRVVRQLSAMSDRELRDIGLVRQDVLDSATLLLEGDASDFLIGRRNERRGARRRTT